MLVSWVGVHFARPLGFDCTDYKAETLTLEGVQM